MDWQTEFLQWITSMQNGFLNSIAKVFTFMGEETFYMLIIPLVYWCISKRAGFNLLYIVLFSLYANTWIKALVPVPRPVGVEGIQSIFLESAESGSHYPNDSFPSSHAQGSATLWGYLAYWSGNPAFWTVAVLMVLLISFFRLYAGLHWPLDIIGGILFGIIFLILGVLAGAVIDRFSMATQWLLALLVPAVLAFLSMEPEGIKISGFLWGAGIAYLLESRHVGFVPDETLWRRGLAYLIGMAGLVLLQTGLKSVLPPSLWADFFRYAVMGLWALLGAPWIFVTTRLYSSDLHASFHYPPRSFV